MAATRLRYKRVALGLLVLVGNAAALNARGMLGEAPAPEITPAPSPEALDLRLRNELFPRAVVYTCATACVDAAVTKSTSCQLHDVLCECDSTNAAAIYLGSYQCVLDSCGSQLALSVSSAAVALCRSASEGLLSSTTPNGAQTVTVSVVTNTDSAGSTYTTFVTAPTGSSSNGGNNNSSSNSSGSGSSGLSTGTIVGIAVGAFGGAVIICAILFLIYRCTRRRNDASSSTVVSQQPAHTPAPPPGYMPVNKAELTSESKPYPSATSTPAPPASGYGTAPPSSFAPSSSPATQSYSVSPQSQPYGPASPQNLVPVPPQPMPPMMHPPPPQQAQFAEMQGSQIPGYVPGPQQQYVYHVPGELGNTPVRQELHGAANVPARQELQGVPYVPPTAYEMPANGTHPR